MAVAPTVVVAVPTMVVILPEVATLKVKISRKKFIGSVLWTKTVAYPPLSTPEVIPATAA